MCPTAIPVNVVLNELVFSYPGLNIGAHKEAAEHFLSALSMQEATGDKSKQLWQTLRRAFLSMVRLPHSTITRGIQVRTPIGSQRSRRSHE